MIIKLIKYLFWGVAWGCTFFVLTNLIGSFTAGDVFLEPLRNDFTRQALGSIGCGICCGTSAVIYTFERIPFGIRIAFHFTVGLTGYFTIAYRMGWMPVESGLYAAIFIAFGILFFVAIWSCFYFYNRYEAKKVNERLKELEHDKAIEI